MFRKIYTAVSLLLLPVFVFAEPSIRMLSLFDINQAYCAIKTNGVLGMDNRDSAFAGRGFGTASTNTMLMLENGDNDLTVEIGSLAWFSPEDKSHNELNIFNQKASCRVELALSEGKKTTVIDRIDIGIDKEGDPYEKNVNVKLKKTISPLVEAGHIPDDYFDESYYPSGMEVFQFTKIINLKGLPEWKWVTSPKFTSTPEQVNSLRQSYVDLWRLFANRDHQGIKQALKESLNSWSLTTGSSPDKVYGSENFVDSFDEPGFEMIPIDWSNYRIDIMNKGRMVRLVNKSMPDVSPLAFYVKNEDGSKRMVYFSPIFSLVNGKYIPVI